MLVARATPSEGSVPFPISSIRTSDFCEAICSILQRREMCPLKVDRLCSKDSNQEKHACQSFFFMEKKGDQRKNDFFLCFFLTVELK